MATQQLSYAIIWQAKRASNPQPSVLETDTLPIELLACKHYKHQKLRCISVASFAKKLFNNFSNHTRTNGTATFTNSEA